MKLNRYSAITPGRKPFKMLYCRIILFFLGRAFKACYRTSREFKREFDSLGPQFSFMIAVQPNGPRIGIGKDKNGAAAFLGFSVKEEEMHVRLYIKHIEAACLLLTFRENVVLSFIRNRIIVKGEISDSMAIMRCINLVMTSILPRFFARKAVKRFRPKGIIARYTCRLRTYGYILFGF